MGYTIYMDAREVYELGGEVWVTWGSTTQQRIFALARQVWDGEVEEGKYKIPIVYLNNTFSNKLNFEIIPWNCVTTAKQSFVVRIGCTDVFACMACGNSAAPAWSRPAAVSTFGPFR